MDWHEGQKFNKNRLRDDTFIAAASLVGITHTALGYMDILPQSLFPWTFSTGVNSVIKTVVACWQLPRLWNFVTSKWFVEKVNTILYTPYNFSIIQYTPTYVMVHKSSTSVHSHFTHKNWINSYNVTVTQWRHVIVKNRFFGSILKKVNNPESTYTF